MIYRMAVSCQEKENRDIYHCFTQANNYYVFIPRK